MLIRLIVKQTHDSQVVLASTITSLIQHGKETRPYSLADAVEDGSETAKFTSI